MLAVTQTLLVLLSLAVLLGSQFAEGYTCGKAPLILNGLVAYFVSLLSLLAVSVLGMVAGAGPHWRTVRTCVLLAWGMAALWLYLPHFCPDLLLTGFKSFVTKAASPEDLRQIRRVVLATCPPGKGDDDFHAITRSPGAPGKDFSSHWDIDSTPDDGFARRWETICAQTKIEKLIGTGRFKLQSTGSGVTLSWGGGFLDLWIVIDDGPIEEDHSDVVDSLRVADGILVCRSRSPTRKWYPVYSPAADGAPEGGSR